MWNVQAFRLQSMLKRLEPLVQSGRTSGETDGSIRASLIGDLLDVLPQVDRLFPLQAIQPLVTLLSTLLLSVRPEDDLVLSSRQRDRLHRVLIPSSQETVMRSPIRRRLEETNVALLPATLSSLGVLGQADTLAVLAEFARRPIESHLREQALAVMEVLRKRVDNRPEVLLRPAAGGEGTS